MAASIHPTGGFLHGIPAPPADNHTRHRGHEPGYRGDGQRPDRHRRELVNCQSQKPDQSAHEHTLPETAKGAFAAAAARGISEPFFDELEITHWFGTPCPRIRRLASQKCSKSHACARRFEPKKKRGPPGRLLHLV